MENEKTLRVVLVLGGIEDGGLEKHTIELSHLLKEKGIEVSVIAHKKFRKDFKNINFIECDLSRSRNNPFILFKLSKLLKKGNFDIIHTQANKATDMIIKLKPFLKSKIVSTLHSYKKNITSFEKTDFVITVSDKIGEKLKNPNKKTIYNGIKIENVNKIDLYKKFNIENDKFLICSIGRFVKVKRFDILLEAMKMVNDKIHLLLIGDGDENIKNLAKQMNNVTYCGYMENKKTKEILNSSKLSVISSEREGFPYVFVESLILQTPLISTDVSDIKKFIGDEFIVKLNSKDLSYKIDCFYNDYENNLKKFDPVFKLAKSEFSIENMVKKTIEVYRKVLSDF